MSLDITAQRQLPPFLNRATNTESFQSVSSSESSLFYVKTNLNSICTRGKVFGRAVCNRPSRSLGQVGPRPYRLVFLTGPGGAQALQAGFLEGVLFTKNTSERDWEWARVSPSTAALLVALQQDGSQSVAQSNLLNNFIFMASNLLNNFICIGHCELGACVRPSVQNCLRPRAYSI